MKNPFLEIEKFHNLGFFLTFSGELIDTKKILMTSKHKKNILTMYKGKKLSFHARDMKHFLRQFRRWRKRNESI